jgi:hypothetical protein
MSFASRLQPTGTSTQAGMPKRLTVMTVILSLCQTMAWGQVYFEGLYGDSSSSQAIGPGGTVSVEDGYLTWAYSYGNYMPYIFQVDTEGNMTHEWFMPQPDTIERIAFNIVTVNDSAFVGLVMVNVLTQSYDVRGDFGLVKFRIDGNVIWENLYGLPDRNEIPQRVAQTSDGGYALVGQAMMGTGASEHGDVYLIRTDSSGNQIWERTYGGSQYDSGIDLLQTSDGGFLLLGWTYSYGAGQRDFYLIKTDSLGNQQWQRTYGGGTDDVGKSIIQLADGNYLLSGSGSQSSGSGSQGMIFKITPLGDIRWEETYIYHVSSTNEFQKTVEVWNGDLVTTGLTDNLSNSGWLVRTDSLGDVMWQREYDKNEYTDLFYSVLIADDDGFLLSGFARNPETNNPDTWLLKVDSVGCAYPNCITGIAEQEGAVLADVWPNPADQFINIAWQRQGEAEIRLIDMSGKEVLRKQSHDQRETIDVSGLPSGLYVVQLVQSEASTSLRIVVQ